MRAPAPAAPALAVAAALSGCAAIGPAPAPVETAPAVIAAAKPAPVETAPVPGPAARPAPPKPAPLAPRGGAFYKDDGPGEHPPAHLDDIPDAVPRVEPLHRFANRPYVVFGRQFVPMTERVPYQERGIASWYGRRYHGRPTSSGEIYDMYAMTGAHPTLPIPSFVRVTNPANGRSVIIRINDRGPFLGDRLIDLSYAAAHRLDLVRPGSGLVEVEKLIPGVNFFAEAKHLGAPLPPVAVKRPVAAAPAGAAAALPIETEAGGIFLQLGAFAERGNAESFLARIKPELGTLGETAHVFARQGLFRVHLGPYPTQAEARSAAERILQALQLKPMVTLR
jgi:rare lipoprotein A